MKLFFLDLRKFIKNLGHNLKHDYIITIKINKLAKFLDKKTRLTKSLFRDFFLKPEIIQSFVNHYWKKDCFRASLFKIYNDNLEKFKEIIIWHFCLQHGPDDHRIELNKLIDKFNLKIIGKNYIYKVIDIVNNDSNNDLTCFKS